MGFNGAEVSLMIAIFNLNPIKPLGRPFVFFVLSLCPLC